MKPSFRPEKFPSRVIAVAVLATGVALNASAAQNPYITLQNVSACLVKRADGYAPRLSFNMRPKEKMETVSLVGTFAINNQPALKSSPYIQFDAEAEGNYKYPVRLLPKSALLAAPGGDIVTLNVIARILPYKDRATLSLGQVTEVTLLSTKMRLVRCAG
ncbi:hypothetical protein [Deinococcus alpinitundrae]|uniref:hypothetical protein n=1 Tax=Deinococcus alpinitundrae TaxID=468913 RepID=UPI00137B44EA|nr:hypothetical protein [Deinococcus alpinitundrae]